MCYDASQRAVYFLMCKMTGASIAGFKWFIGDSVLKASHVIAGMKAEICERLDISRQNKLQLLQTRTHKLYRPQEYLPPLVILHNSFRPSNIDDNTHESMVGSYTYTK